MRQVMALKKDLKAQDLVFGLETLHTIVCNCFLSLATLSGEVIRED